MKVINLSDKKVSLELTVEEFNKLQETEKRIRELEEELNKEKESKSLFVTSNFSYLTSISDRLDRYNSLIVCAGSSVKDTDFGKEIYQLKSDLEADIDKRDKIKNEINLNIIKLNKIPKFIRKIFKINT